MRGIDCAFPKRKNASLILIQGRKGYIEAKMTKIRRFHRTTGYLGIFLCAESIALIFKALKNYPTLIQGMWVY
jgi:hypothetical protein